MSLPPGASDGKTYDKVRKRIRDNYLRLDTATRKLVLDDVAELVRRYPWMTEFVDELHTLGKVPAAESDVVYV